MQYQYLYANVSTHTMTAHQRIQLHLPHRELRILFSIVLAISPPPSSRQHRGNMLLDPVFDVTLLTIGLTIGAVSYVLFGMELTFQPLFIAMLIMYILAGLYVGIFILAIYTMPPNMYSSSGPQRRVYLIICTT
jgi:hypothetical protein